ncbi:hypothetical protein ACFVWR_15415 [Leifsonia sp. NPDC058292]|uniref:hypothetical protein n=1 Tax=Leifsonia sp. NPDC058292 TaxID=3346428 RepID=UPI0036DF8845
MELGDWPAWLAVCITLVTVIASATGTRRMKVYWEKLDRLANTVGSLPHGSERVALTRVVRNLSAEIVIAEEVPGYTVCAIGVVALAVGAGAGFGVGIAQLFNPSIAWPVDGTIALWAAFVLYMTAFGLWLWRAMMRLRWRRERFLQLTGEYPSNSFFTWRTFWRV